MLQLKEGLSYGEINTWETKALLDTKVLFQGVNDKHQNTIQLHDFRKTLMGILLFVVDAN